MSILILFIGCTLGGSLLVVGISLFENYKPGNINYIIRNIDRACNFMMVGATILILTLVIVITLWLAPEQTTVVSTKTYKDVVSVKKSNLSDDAFIVKVVNEKGKIDTFEIPKDHLVVDAKSNMYVSRQKIQRDRSVDHWSTYNEELHVPRKDLKKYLENNK